MELYTEDKDGKKTDAHFHMDYLDFQDKNREKLNNLILKREKIERQIEAIDKLIKLKV